MTKKIVSQSERTKKMVTMAMLAAVSIVLMLLIRFPLIPSAGWLEYDMADVPIMLGAFMLGPVRGLGILMVVSLIQAFLLGGNGIIGFVMHFFATGVWVVAATLIYRLTKEKTWGMIVGLIVGIICWTLLMLPMNMVFTPILFGVDVEFVKSMMLTVLVPFNLLKSGLNSVIFFLLYKALRFVIRKQQDNAEQ